METGSMQERAAAARSHWSQVKRQVRAGVITSAEAAPHRPHISAAISLGWFRAEAVTELSLTPGEQLWVLEDPDWCCKHDCNDKSGADYRQAYVCADPTDTSGRLTSACEVETECKRSEPPKMCSASKLRELQQYNSVLDPKCSGRATGAPSCTTRRRGSPRRSRSP
jgi:hypothetical protein